MAETLHEAMLAALPQEQEDVIPAEGATDAVGLRERIMRARTTLDEAARGEPSGMSMEEGIQGVRDVHSALEALGYDVGPVSHADIFGPEMRAALRQFQEEHELPRSGRLDADTVEALMSLYEQALESGSRDEEPDDFTTVPG